MKFGDEGGIRRREGVRKKRASGSEELEGDKSCTCRRKGSI